MQAYISCAYFTTLFSVR